MSVKIIKMFRADIKSCKDYSLSERELCVISDGDSFGLAEKHANGKKDILIECGYDYIDTFCGANGFTNMVAVLNANKWGLYAFRRTLSSKTNKINCQKVAEVEYDSITIHQNQRVAILRKNGKDRFYNLFSGRLSDFCGCSVLQDSNLLLCVGNSEQKWIDTASDMTVYSFALEGGTDVYQVCKDIYIFKTCYEKDGDYDYRTDLVVYDSYRKLSYTVFDVYDLRCETSHTKAFLPVYTVNFKKDGANYSVSRRGNEWSAEGFFSVAEEMDYSLCEETTEE